MNLSNFKFRQLLEINKRKGDLSNKDDLFFCMCRHISSTDPEKHFSGFTLRDCKIVLQNDLNDDTNIESMLNDLVTDGKILFKNKKYYIK